LSIVFYKIFSKISQFLTKLKNLRIIKVLSVITLFYLTGANEAKIKKKIVICLMVFIKAISITTSSLKHPAEAG